MRAVLAEHPRGVAAHFRYDPDANEALKSCGWRWDPSERVWWGRLHTVDDAVEALEDLGYEVSDERRRNAPPPPPPPPPPPVPDRAFFYRQLLERIPSEERERKYKELIRAFHPDVYGDSEEAKAINAAWDAVRGRNRRPA
jgi:hypothetical protein